MLSDHPKFVILQGGKLFSEVFSLLYPSFDNTHLHDTSFLSIFFIICMTIPSQKQEHI